MSNYKIINRSGKEISTDVALHPGEVLQMELEARGLKKGEVAAELGLNPGNFSELLHGRRHVGAALALRLESLFNISAEYWMRTQVYYDLFVERSKRDKAA